MSQHQESGAVTNSTSHDEQLLFRPLGRPRMADHLVKQKSLIRRKQRATKKILEGIASYGNQEKSPDMENVLAETCMDQNSFQMQDDTTNEDIGVYTNETAVLSDDNNNIVMEDVYGFDGFGNPNDDYAFQPEKEFEVHVSNVQYHHDPDECLTSGSGSGSDSSSIKNPADYCSDELEDEFVFVDSEESSGIMRQ